MPEYADIYVLGRERSPDLIIRFLDHFLPARGEAADEYAVPQYADTPQIVFKTADELINHCCQHSKEAYSIYWRSKPGDEHAEVYFLEDGGVIFGVSTPAENQMRVDAVSSELGRFFETDEIFVTYEDLPPDSVDGFKAFLASLPAIVDLAAAEAARRTRAHRPIEV
ncbi:hypothetical protein [Verrucomicrobium sp. BvORR106]|uniref:hypothetical protein n=1 Tax=Verrucomicrobium sp. BvORR106 TaxID=1403819 RepID=UPI00056EEC73|nr:hypothetical protein [Verrucomicrobium sp. BvORR106]